MTESVIIQKIAQDTAPLFRRLSTSGAAEQPPDAEKGAFALQILFIIFFLLYRPRYALSISLKAVFYAVFRLELQQIAF